MVIASSFCLSFCRMLGLVFLTDPNSMTYAVSLYYTAIIVLQRKINECKYLMIANLGSVEVLLAARPMRINQYCYQ